ncbi:BREX-6 system adenine-specific DNA-methyltransferase PglX [Myxococcota bacterium]|nr:BREX-6 system adenine-specific DNA-methyltransferase PglX [Myxococcota bacterium]
MAPQNTQSALSKMVRAQRDALLLGLNDALTSRLRLALPLAEARLSEADRRLRAQLGETVEDPAKRAALVKEAGALWLTRIVTLRVMEARGLRRRRLVSGKAHENLRDWRELHHLRPEAPAALEDESGGLRFVLRLVFEDLSLSLPGLYGDAGPAERVPMPINTLNGLLSAVNDPELDDRWHDPLTLGWVVQFWNDPDREALDAKINDGGKITAAELASKTQMFTERYMVDWMVQNTLGPLWLGLCEKRKWTPRVVRDGVLDRLAERRAAQAQARAAGTIEPTEPMSVGDDERAWAYYLPQPHHPPTVQSLRELKILDPAMGSGHFLLVAMDWLIDALEEEAEHRGEDSPLAQRVQQAVRALHGVDLDPRAVRTAAASLWIAAQARCPGVELGPMNLVAASFGLHDLPPGDRALARLTAALKDEHDLPEPLTQALVGVLQRADSLGSLLRVEREVLAVLAERGPLMANEGADLGGVLKRLRGFLARHTDAEDLGVATRGRALAAGARFMQIVEPGRYDVVLANPPYLGTARMADAVDVAEAYPQGKADLYAAFLLRGLELVKPGGLSAMLTMRSWMFVGQYEALRTGLLQAHTLRSLGDFDRGAFESIPDQVVSVVASVFQAGKNPLPYCVAVLPTNPNDESRDSQRTQRKRVATLEHHGRYEFVVESLKVVPYWPLIYWWDSITLNLFVRYPLVQNVSQVAQGLVTADNVRFVRQVWEAPPVDYSDSRNSVEQGFTRWTPIIMGAAGLAWFEPLITVVNWHLGGLEIHAQMREGRMASRPQNMNLYYQKGIAFSMIGAEFAARAHRYPSIFEAKGSSVFPENIPQTLCAMNTTKAREILQALNPTISFQVGDVERLPLFPVESAEEIFRTLEASFAEHESHRETSVEFCAPGPSSWVSAQAWAQRMVDRPAGAPLAPFEPELVPPSGMDWISFALGQALGRFPSPAGAAPGGLFLDGSQLDGADDLGLPACAPLRAAWEAHGRGALGAHLRLRHFKDDTLPRYESRPIFWPLSSSKRTFVVWVCCHTLTDTTLAELLAERLLPRLRALEGELEDAQTTARFEDVNQRRRPVIDELRAFCGDWAALVNKGPKAVTPPPELEAPLRLDPDDGVLINTAALWSLLAPQWDAPRKVFEQLSRPQGKKDYDWSQLAARVWPARVEAACVKDPSLAVAHRRLWRLHPAVAFAWALRLADERPESPPPIAEPDAETHRAAFLTTRGAEALAVAEREAQRRARKGRPATVKVPVGLKAAHEALWAKINAALRKKHGAGAGLEEGDGAGAAQGEMF